MIVQAIGLLDDLDKEINTYGMRVKEWYGWHFPEVRAVFMNVQGLAVCADSYHLPNPVGQTRCGEHDVRAARHESRHAEEYW